MTSITLSERSLPNTLSTLIPEAKVPSDGTLTLPSPQTVPAIPFSVLANEPGVMDGLLNHNSLKTDTQQHSSFLVSSHEQEKNNGTLSRTNTTEADLSRLAQMTANAASSFGNQGTSLLSLSHSTDSTKEANDKDQSTGIISTAPTQSHPQVAGGTDITAVKSPFFKFVNIFSDTLLLCVQNMLIVITTTIESLMSRAAALATGRSVESAERMGNKVVDAARTQRDSAITSGTLGIVGQGASSGIALKTFHDESRSLSSNLDPSRKTNNVLETNAKANQASLDDPIHNLSHGDKTQIAAGLSANDGPLRNESNTLDMNHNDKQILTHKIRTITDFSNQAIQSSQGIITGSFNLEASQDTKESHLAQADQNVQNEGANSHQQSAKKSADSRMTLQQLFENIQNTNNSTVSAIADRIR